MAFRNRDIKVSLLIKRASDLTVEAARMQINEQMGHVRYKMIEREYIIVNEMLADYDFSHDALPFSEAVDELLKGLDGKGGFDNA